MVKRGGLPSCCHVTRGAVRAAIECDVITGKAGCRGAIVATVTPSRTNVGMVEDCRLPVGGVVAGFTISTGGNVGRRVFGAQGALAGGGGSVVAGEAGAH